MKKKEEKEEESVKTIRCIIEVELTLKEPIDQECADGYTAHEMLSLGEIIEERFSYRNEDDELICGEDI